VKALLYIYLIGAAITCIALISARKFEMTNVETGKPAPWLAVAFVIVVGAVLWPIGIVAAPMLLASGDLHIEPKGEDEEE
jgi:hypothetical protein